MDCNGDFIRATACVRFANLIGNRSGVACELALGASVIVRRPDDRTISQHVYAATVSWAPGEGDITLTSLSEHISRERNTSAGGSTEKERETDVVEYFAGGGDARFKVRIAVRAEDISVCVD